MYLVPLLIHSLSLSVPPPRDTFVKPDEPALTPCAVLGHSVMTNYLQPYGLQAARLLSPWGFSRQEYWSVLPCPPPGELPNSGIELRSPALQVDSLPTEPPRTPTLTHYYHSKVQSVH